MMASNSEFLRLSQVRQWLAADYKMSKTEIARLFRNHDITGESLRPGARKFYRRSQILREVLRYETATRRKK